MFWVAFFILIVGLFMMNRDKIRQTLEDTQVLTRFSISLPGFEEVKDSEEDVSVLAPSARPAAPAITVTQKPPVQETSVKPADTPPAAKPAAPSAKPADAEPAAPVKLAAQPPAAPPAASRQTAGDRERALYFTQVDAAGTILRTKVARSIPASDSPLVDSLKALLGGPNAEEQRRGMVSLIPKGVKILSATIRGSTAYISFSEEFQYNTYGVEGYAAQLKQIVWTATEFPTVKDVQILIDGRRIDYLGEGIWIGSPLSRDTL
ncbi:hypothetical protein AGMMS49587_09610 [Spirochaetia bacterium]|nr:hypothetical protein AGMMS49587_09610 [Spirochaetia bacterium]